MPANSVAAANSATTAVDPSNIHSDSRPTLVFGLIGDQPYGDFFEQYTQTLIEQINQDPLTNFILHAGDIKGGSEPCTDQVILRRLAQLKSSAKPLIYAVGDNEWTDCHRDGSGGFSPLERLGFLRTSAFAVDRTLGQHGFEVSSQRAGGWPEHQMWKTGGTLFITLNVPGSNNNLENPSTRNETEKAVLAEYQGRQSAIRAWLNEAERWIGSDPSITQSVLLIQGNPIDGSGKSWLNHLPFGQSDGYRPFREQLIHFIAATQRPLLLIHGDTHRFKWDQPDLIESVEADSSQKTDINGKISAGVISTLDKQQKDFVRRHFFRLEGWGHPYVNRWVRVSIHDGQANPFKVMDVELPKPLSD